MGNLINNTCKIGKLVIKMMLPFLLKVVIDVVTELARDGVLSVLLHADDLVTIFPFT